MLRFMSGDGGRFKKDMQNCLDVIKREVPQLFESEEYINRKNQIAEAHEKKVMSFYKAIEDQGKGYRSGRGSHANGSHSATGCASAGGRRT